MENIPVHDSINTMDESTYQNYIEKLKHANELTKQLNSIPHLKLELPEFDHQTALNEAMNCSNNNFSPIQNCDFRDRHGPRTDHNTWSSRALVNYVPYSDQYCSFYDREDSAEDFPELQPEAWHNLKQGKAVGYQHMKYYKTEIYDKMPYTTSYLEKYVYNTSNRILLWKLAAGGKIGWHHHSNKQGNTNVNDNIIVHFPIMTNPNVKMLVKIDNITHEHHYELGSAYVFNSVHDHAVTNYSNEDRIHIIVMIPFNDEKIWDTIKKSLINHGK
jgi:hypothetical protein